MTFSRLAGTVFLIAAIPGCSSVPRIVNEYKIDVQQGNVLTQDQVRFVLGTPVLMDMFHANRWDYVYWLKKGSTGTVVMRKFSTYFDAYDRLERVTGDVTAAQASDETVEVENKVREIDLGSISVDSEAPPLEEKGFFGKMMESVGF